MATPAALNGKQEKVKDAERLPSQWKQNWGRPPVPAREEGRKLPTAWQRPRDAEQRMRLGLIPWSGIPGTLPASGTLERSVRVHIHSCYCCLVVKSRPPLCGPKDCHTPGSSVRHYLLEFAQIQVHCVGDAVSPSHSLLPPLLLPSIFSGIRVLSEARALTQHSKGAEASRQWQLKCPKTGPILENASLDRREKLERKKRGAMNLLAPQIKIQSHLVFFVTKPHVFFVLFFFFFEVKHDNFFLILFLNFSKLY